MGGGFRRGKQSAGPFGRRVPDVEARPPGLLACHLLVAGRSVAAAHMTHRHDTRVRQRHHPRRLLCLRGMVTTVCGRHARSGVAGAGRQPSRLRRQRVQASESDHTRGGGSPGRHRGRHRRRDDQRCRDGRGQGPCASHAWIGWQVCDSIQIRNHQRSDVCDYWGYWYEPDHWGRHNWTRVWPGDRDHIHGRCRWSSMQVDSPNKAPHGGTRHAGCVQRRCRTTASQSY